MTYLYPYRRGTGWRSQGFRSRPNQGANGPGGHTGFDQAMESGQPLYAPADGIIRNSGWLSDNYRDNGWWLTRMGGDTLVIDCTDAFGRSDRLPTFIFAHCSDTMAEVGQRVKKGQLVALSGNTGTATTGAHVHIEALPPQWDFNNGVYGRVDPELYFDEWVDDYLGGVTVQGDIIPEEDDDMATPEQIWKHRLPMGDQTFEAGDILVYARTNAEGAKNNAETAVFRADAAFEAAKAAPAAAVEILLGTRLEAPDGSGKSYTIADYLVFGWWYAMQAKDKPQGPPMDPAALTAAIQASATDVASRLEITVKDTP